ncbi:MAG: hypothetical protein RLY83_778 [Actinomycetota bacterium]|jgi:hypothetical protein
MSQEFRCSKCEWKFDAQAKSKCPSCHTPTDELLKISAEIEAKKAAEVVLQAKKVASESSPPAVTSKTSTTQSNELIEAIERQIAATNRTTHATRAIVIILQFFMANVLLFGSWFLFGSPNNVMVALIFLAIWVVGAIVTAVRSGRALSKSEI